MVDTCQYICIATDDELNAFKQALSNARMSTYEGFTKHNLRKAVTLYDINLSISTHIFDLLHGLEIPLRNKMDEALSTKYSTPHWFDDGRFKGLVGPKSKKRINEAKYRARSKGTNMLPGHVIAELTLGFWTSLYAKSLYRDLWVGCFETIWPATTGLDQLRADLEAVRKLRNRIAHHEPIFTNTHLKVHKVLLHRIKQLSPVTRAVFESRLNGKIADLQKGRNVTLQ